MSRDFDKIQYKKTEISFYGDTYTVNGHKPADEKKRAITEMPKPTNVKELQSFLGVCHFLSKYSPRSAELSDDLHQLTCKGIPYNWGPEHKEAFNALKEELTSASVLQYYDPKKSLVLQMDASAKGLSTVLLQESQPVYFTSEALSPCQWSYVALKLEALAVGWAVKKFHHFLYGWQFTLEMDQKPLKAILNKSLLEASPQMQQLLMKTIPYDMVVRYIPGPTNVVADCLSRAPITSDRIQLPILQVHEITKALKCTADCLQQLCEKTIQDDTLALPKHTIQAGWPVKIQQEPPEI